MESDEIKTLISHVLAEVVEYKTNSIMIKTIIEKPTGDIKVMSFDTGTSYPDQVSLFDTFFFVIEGSAEITINGKLKKLPAGGGILIPAHHRNKINAKERFKMMVTIIKSGYE